MVELLVRHNVEDYDKWKPYFDRHDDIRKEYGQQGYRLLRSSDDSNDLVMVFAWDTPENARRFLEESDLEEIMGEAGVIDEPEIAFLEEIEVKSPEAPTA